MADPRFRRILTALHRDDRGSIVVIVAFSMFFVVAAAALAIDLGKQLTATAEAQAAADAAALAGAGALATVPGENELARTEAALFAEKNEILGEPVTLDPDVDVTFPGTDSIRVEVRRTSGSPDGPISSIFARFLGIDSMSVTREATARVRVTGSVPTCLMPLGIPDLWLEEPGGTVAGQNDVFDPGTDTYRAPSSHPQNFTGYQVPRDWGREVVIYKSGGPGTFNPSWWGMWNSTGNDDRGTEFKRQITTKTCSPDWDTAEFDQVTYTTPGASQGPVSGCVGGGGGCGADNGTALIQLDPNADWADPGTADYVAAGCTQSTGCMVRTENGKIKQISSSPRIRPLPLYHPEDVVNSSPGDHKQTRITNFTGVFFDRVEGDGSVVGYVVGLVGAPDEDAPSSGVTTRSVQLIQ